MLALATRRRRPAQPWPSAPPAATGPGSATGPWLGFVLFLVVNAMLFVRPADFVPELLGLQLYQAVIITCLAVSFTCVLPQLTARSLSERPISAFVLGLLVAVVLSHLSHVQLEQAASTGWEFFKVVLYYLLFVGLVTTPARLRQFLWWFGVFTTVLVTVAVLQYHGILSLAQLTTLQDRLKDPLTGKDIFIPRLRSTGIFNDPNDLCLVLVVGMPLSLYWLTERRSGAVRLLWLVPLLLFGYALTLTQSRGGFVAFLLGLLTFFHARFGWKRTLLLGAVALPAVFVLFAGRQTSLSTGESTGQLRIQLWSDGVMMLKDNPLFGVGCGRFHEEAGQVAHNSFIHCYAELGLLGGTLFLGAFAVGAWRLRQLGSNRVQIRDPELRRLRPYLVAAIAAYVGGMLSLSNCYLVPTYTMLALVVAYLGMAAVDPPLPALRLNGRLLSRVAVVSVVFLAAMYVFVRLFVRWT